MIALSMRYDRVDNFWFLLRHEIEHILNRDGRVTIDIELPERIRRKDDLPKEEVRANLAAADFCVPRAEFDSFITSVRPLYSEQSILLFAKRIAVHPGLVVGQLQHRGEVPWTHFHKLLVKVKDTITQASVADGWGLAIRGRLAEA